MEEKKREEEAFDDSKKLVVKVYPDDMEKLGFGLKLMVFSLVKTYCDEYGLFDKSCRWINSYFGKKNNPQVISKILFELVDEGLIQRETTYSAKHLNYYKFTVPSKEEGVLKNNTPGVLESNTCVLKNNTPPMKAEPLIPLSPITPITNITPSVKTDTEKNTITHSFPKGKTFMLPKYNSQKNGKGLSLAQTARDASLSKKSLSFTETTKRLFDEFWNAYPPRQAMNRRKCWKEWCQIPDIDTKGEKIITAVKVLKNSERWIEEDGRFIPYSLAFLEAGYWVAAKETQCSVEDDTSHSTLEEFNALAKELGLIK